MNRYTTWGLAFNIWCFTSLLFAIGATVYINLDTISAEIFVFFPAFFASLAGSVPVLVTLLIAIPIIKNNVRLHSHKVFFLFLIEALAIIPYGIAGGAFQIFDNDHLFSGVMVYAALYACAVSATLIFLEHIHSLFNPSHYSSVNAFTSGIYQPSTIKKTTMETIPGYQPQSQSNKVLIKGLIAGGLILLMLIPTFLIMNLISEREARQKEVVQEVSAKWATAQTMAGPYLVVPYTEAGVTADGKSVIFKKNLVLLSQQMNLGAEIIPANRPRSIYKVLLYKSIININGTFQPKWPVDINPATLDLTNAKLCFGLSDFKGIEEEIFVDFNKKRLALSPGLPENTVSNAGLSVPVSVSLEDLNAGIPFTMNVKLRGSERLHFLPLSANSNFQVKSSWPDPSFDGNTLPSERKITDKGFTSKWQYNQANLPYSTVIKNDGFTKSDMAFGVSMVQPADQYNKTMRSVKYAILIIGLTFSLFFIIELMQGKPFHPVQYVLVGLALVIFYTLLLAISEYMLFDYAYLIASAATVTLISLYAKSHFHSWKTSSVFGAVLGSLYGFIFILLRLEDTALLVGSIGLFVVLAVVMYVSRKVDWYGSTRLKPAVAENIII